MASISDFQKAAEAIAGAEVLIITAGAGMGVDSGLPDFRGERGFWKAYPMYQRLGISFTDAANPAHFSRDPSFGWGFYGHRLHLYRETLPHPGFGFIQDWIRRFQPEYFVVTSNVDGQFQKAGFDPDRIEEVHGSIHHLQCQSPCTDEIWENKAEVPVDLATMRAGEMPRCPRCGAIARPNILMFGDWGWIGDRSLEQGREFERFLTVHQLRKMVVLEVGAGTFIPSIRRRSEWLAYTYDADLIRINPVDYHIPMRGIQIRAGGLAGLQGIHDALNS